jgi:putative spermidine/putrescine transport system ATP-binding protein
MLRFEGVSKTYPARRGQPAPPALAGLDLVVARGELLTLLGPAGYGKTTTLMPLAGFETPDAGRIPLESRDIARLPAHKRNIGVVLRTYALFARMTVAAPSRPEPPFVLLDEPLGALDKALREEMQHAIRGLHRRLGLTMI